MIILKTPAQMKEWRAQQAPSRIGFVPTMGALHEGHAELLRRSRTENDLCALSIFVNPTQFNNPEDLKNYPQTWTSDIALAEKHGVDVIFAPVTADLYPDQYHFKVSENEDSQKLCGAYRPGHFDGVLTVVMKLFQIVKPHRAYFGEKDFQQLRLIQQMISAFFLDIELVPVATIREQSGLAMSSRNLRLNSNERDHAAILYKIISEKGLATEEARKNLEKEGFRVDYVEDLWNRRFVAAHLGNVRLIDNVEL